MTNNKDIIFFEILQITKTMKKVMDKSCKKYALNPLQLLIITLSDNSNMTVSKLAEVLDVSKSAISQSLLKLYVKKYVVKRPVEGNKKIFYIENLNKGKQVQDEVLKVIKAKGKAINENMTEEEITNLKLLLAKYTNILKNID